MLTNGDVDLGELVVATAEDVARVTRSDLETRAPTEGRVAQLTNSDDRDQVMIADGEGWLEIEEFGLTNVDLSDLESRVEDLEDEVYEG